MLVRAEATDRATARDTVTFHHSLFEESQPPRRFHVLASALEHLPEPFSCPPQGCPAGCASVQTLSVMARPVRSSRGVSAFRTFRQHLKVCAMFCKHRQELAIMPGLPARRRAPALLFVQETADAGDPGTTSAAHHTSDE